MNREYITKAHYPTQTPVGATVNIRWKDSPEELRFEEYISFGEYNEDEENDGLGVSDLFIFGYVDSLEELETMKTTNPNFDWLLVEIIEVHYA
jgi:hypothetical protein